MTKPKRVQLSRKKGWRMPPNTVKVDRSTRWGNPYSVQRWGREQAVSLFREMFRDPPRGSVDEEALQAVRSELRGRDLACWCQPGELCHADVLLEIANAQIQGPLDTV